MRRFGRWRAWRSAQQAEQPSGDAYYPATVSGIVAGYDATALAFADGELVTSWTDRVNGYDLAPNATWNGATMAVDAFGAGLHAVDFLGKSAQFDAPADVRAALAATGEAELWIVTGGITGARGGDGGDFGSASVGFGGTYPWNSTQLYSSFCGAVERSFGTFSGIASPHVARWYYRADTGTAGIETGTGGSMILRGSNAYAFSLDATIKIGGNYNNTYFWGGNMAEVLIFDRFLGDGSGDDAAVASYLATRWAV